MNSELLLLKVSHISKEYDSINKKTGGYFNIFDIAGISTDEVSICKFIYDLINPKGSHYQGYTYLKLFVENVLNMKFSDSEYEKATVYREYGVNGRRVDLVINIDEKRIPIEVKIYASDQINQCHDYYKNCAKNSNIFYLTLDGRPPSKESARGLTKIDYKDENGGYKEVSQISFKDEILTWLDKCVSDSETIKIAPIREVILQFIEVIKNMTNTLKKDKEKEIVNLISESRENMRSALDIQQSLEKSRIEMMKKVLGSLECKLDENKEFNNYQFKKQEQIEYYKANNYQLVEWYYTKNKRTYPGISYFIKTLDKEKEIDLLLRIEIQDRIVVGFCTPKRGKSVGKLLNDNEIKNILKNYNSNEIDWEYLPEGSIDKCPNFKYFNEKHLDLFDKNEFDKFINRSCTFILKYIRNLK